MVRAAAADCAGSEASSLTLRTILAPSTPPALLIWSTASCMPFLLWTPVRIPAPVTERSAPSLIVLPAYELVAPPPPPPESQATTIRAATKAETRPTRFTPTVFHVRWTSRRESGLSELHGNDFQGHQLASAQDGQPKLRPDLRLHHQALQIARFADGHVADRDDDVSAAKRGRSRRTARDHLLHLDPSLAAQALRHGGRQRSGAAGDAEEGPANAAAPHQRGQDGLRGLVDRHRQTETLPGDGCVDAYEPRPPVGQRAARVARVERGIGLD